MHDEGLAWSHARGFPWLPHGAWLARMGVTGAMARGLACSQRIQRAQQTSQKEIAKRDKENVLKVRCTQHASRPPQSQRCPGARQALSHCAVPQMLVSSLNAAFMQGRKVPLGLGQG